MGTVFVAYVYDNLNDRKVTLLGVFSTPEKAQEAHREFLSNLEFTPHPEESGLGSWYAVSSSADYSHVIKEMPVQ
jgi:hypothetical protein